MIFCHIKPKNLIKFSLVSSEILNKIYDAFGRQPYAYPLVNSQGYYRKAAIKYWIDNAFPNAPAHIRDKAAFVLWHSYNNFSPDEVVYKKVQDE